MSEVEDLITQAEDEDLIRQAIQDANNEEFQNDLLDEDLEPQDEGLTIVD